MDMLQFIKMSPFLDPADFIGKSNVMVTFAPSDSASEQFVSVSVVNDDIVENNEMFTAMLTTTGSMVTIGPSNTATATIVDDDGKSVDNLISMIYMPPSCGAIMVQCLYTLYLDAQLYIISLDLDHVLHSQASFLASTACSIKFALKTH